MAEDSDKKTTNSTPENFTVTFKNGALAQLRDAANILGISNDPEGLGEVLMKGLKFIQLAKKNKVTIDTDKERIQVDLKHL